MILPPMTAGEICTVDFYIELPALYASTFSFSPAIADGTLEHYAICDWIDNAVVLPWTRSVRPSTASSISPAAWKSTRSIGDGAPESVNEFTGERVIPGEVNDDLWAEHIARYAFAVAPRRR